MLCHVFVFFPVVSRSFVPPFFLCREIPENVLVDNYWRFHTSNFNSRESNFYDSHAQRERTLAWSEKHHRRVAVGGERGLTHWHIFNFCWSQFFLFFWGGGCVSKYRCRAAPTPWNTGLRFFRFTTNRLLSRSRDDLLVARNEGRKQRERVRHAAWWGSRLPLGVCANYPPVTLVERHAPHYMSSLEQ